MRNHKVSLPVLISFSELAWIMVFAFAFVFVAYVTKSSRVNENDEAYKKLSEEKRRHEEDYNKLLEKEQECIALRQTLDKTRNDLSNSDERYQEAEEKYRKSVNEKKQYEEYCNTLKEEKKQGEEKYNNLLQKYNNLLFNKENNISLDEKVIRREIVGLKGKLERVAVLFDTSSSMKKGNRWELARNVVATWLNYLPINECVLITFKSSVNIFPPNGSFWDMRGTQGETNRKSLLEILKSINASGGTDTLAALKKAYSYKNVDTIILFTDGEPSVEGFSIEELTEKEIPKIFELCKKHPDVTINTVGLGNYFEAKLSSFLINIAKETGGVFIGR